MSLRATVCTSLVISLLGCPRSEAPSPPPGPTVQPVCGNGVVEFGEACDDGNEISLDGCLNNCIKARCGDGLVRIDVSEGMAGFELCDDGDSSDTDGCKTDCQPARCGDGLRRGDLRRGEAGYEACDDGNDADEDACLNNCLQATCGDGITRLDLADGEPLAEACDDGNDANDDACTRDCIQARCGDGIQRTDLDTGDEDHEACDDGNEVATDACLNDCNEARCGDAVVWEGEEQCDDGNLNQQDDCLGNCEIARCGDGELRTGVEDCDDGNLNQQDDCLNNCEIARCGDGQIHNGSEDCDDGNADQGDACLNNCETARCGDGQLRRGMEACDDGNRDDDDDCTNNCQLAPLGSTAQRPGISCKSLLEGQGDLEDGSYWIDPDGQGAGHSFRVYCDMTRNGGGWILMASLRTTTGADCRDQWPDWSEDWFASDHGSPHEVDGDWSNLAASRLLPLVAPGTVLRVDTEANDVKRFHRGFQQADWAHWQGPRTLPNMHQGLPAVTVVGPFNLDHVLVSRELDFETAVQARVNGDWSIVNGTAGNFFLGTGPGDFGDRDTEGLGARFEVGSTEGFGYAGDQRVDSRWQLWLRE